MRDCVFLLADKNMEYAIRGLFQRDKWADVVGCAAFDMDIHQDLLVAVGRNDPGLYSGADEYLRPLRSQYDHVVVIMDAEWGGAPPAENIRRQLQEHLRRTGWEEEQALALVVEPEIDIWMWIDSPHTATEIGFESYDVLRRSVQEKGLWTPGAPKPHRPKEALEWARKESRKPRSSALYQSIVRKASLRRCDDLAANQLLSALRRWFPANPPQE